MHVLRLVLIGIAIGVAIILGVRFVGNPLRDPAPVAQRKDPPTKSPPTKGPPTKSPPPAAKAAQPPLLAMDEARKLIDSQLRAAGEYEPFFAGLKQNFPADYERIYTALTERARTPGATVSADVYLAEALRGLRQSQGILASKASIAQIERVFDEQAKVMRELAGASPKLCADFVFGAASPAFFEFSNKHRALIATMAEAGLEAIVDGRSKNIEHAPPSDADFSAFEQALNKKGLGKPEIEALLDGKLPDPPLSNEAMCRAGNIFYETLRELPEDARLRIYALAIKLLARS